MSFALAVKPQPAPITALTISRNLDTFDLLIAQMEAAQGERWGDLDIDGAVAFLRLPAARMLEFITITLESRDERNLGPISELTGLARSLGIGVILVARDLTPTGLHQVLRLGADDLLTYPMPDSALQDAIDRLHGRPPHGAAMHPAAPARPLMPHFAEGEAPMPAATGAEMNRTDRLADLKTALLVRLGTAMADGGPGHAPGADLRAVIESSTGAALEEMGFVLNNDARMQLCEELHDEMTGPGPLAPLLRDDSVAAILVDGPHRILVERAGRLELSSTTFDDEPHLQRAIGRLAVATIQPIKDQAPYLEARLADGARLHAMLPPLAVDGSLVSIRKADKAAVGIAHLLDCGALSEDMASYLQAVIAARLNVIVAGDGGSGRTTVLGVLASFIARTERVIAIEDRPELHLQHPQLSRIASGTADGSGTAAVTQRDCLHHALRMRADRIILGEVMGAEVIGLLHAIRNGLDGALTTVRASSPQDAVNRLEGMGSADMPVADLRHLIATSVNVIVQTARLQDGSRRIVSICEVTGMVGGVIALQEMFTFERLGRTHDDRIVGHHNAVGQESHFAGRLRRWDDRDPTAMQIRDEGAPSW